MARLILSQNFMEDKTFWEISGQENLNYKIMCMMRRREISSTVGGSDFPFICGLDQPIVTMTSYSVFPGVYGTTQPSTAVPSTVRDFTPFSTLFGFTT